MRSSKTGQTLPQFPDEQRRNWGFWDGVNDRKIGRYAEWVRPFQTDTPHPFDAPYGEGYWLGRNGQPHPLTGEVVRMPWETEVAAGTAEADKSFQTIPAALRG